MDEGELEALLAGERGEFQFELTQQIVDSDADDLRGHRAGVEPRNIEQCAEDFLHRFERGVDIADQPRLLAAALSFDQAGHVQSRGIERLQDVVARGGEKARLGNVGLLGGALGAAELGVQPFQFAGAFAYPPFQRLVGALERLGRLNRRGDVGEGDDDAAVRHVIGTDFDDEIAVGKAFEKRFRRVDIARQPLMHQFVDFAGPEGAFSRVEAQDVVEADADPHHVGRQIENLAELAVPADELHVLVEDGNALAHVIERGLEDFAVVMDRRTGVVEQLEGGLGRERLLPQQQRQHEARGRRADRRCQQMLGISQQLKIGHRLRLEAHPLAPMRSFRTRSGCVPRRDSGRRSWSGLRS